MGPLGGGDGWRGRGDCDTVRSRAVHRSSAQVFTRRPLDRLHVQRVWALRGLCPTIPRTRRQMADLHRRRRRAAVERRRSGDPIRVAGRRPDVRPGGSRALLLGGDAARAVRRAAAADHRPQPVARDARRRALSPSPTPGFQPVASDNRVAQLGRGPPRTMIGTTLAHYKVTAALGAGGMGEVWRAVDEKLGREVALKVLPEEFAQDPERMARFEREAKVLAQPQSPEHRPSLRARERGHPNGSRDGCPTRQPRIPGRRLWRTRPACKPRIQNLCRTPVQAPSPRPQAPSPFW